MAFLPANCRLMISSFSERALTSSASVIVFAQQRADWGLQGFRQGDEQIRIRDGQASFSVENCLSGHMHLFYQLLLGTSALAA